MTLYAIGVTVALVVLGFFYYFNVVGTRVLRQRNIYLAMFQPAERRANVVISDPSGQRRVVHNAFVIGSLTRTEQYVAFRVGRDVQDRGTHGIVLVTDANNLDVGHITVP